MFKNNALTWIFIFILVINFTAEAQQKSVSGEINIVQDERVDQLINKHIENNASFDGATGYRIQIFFDSGSNAKTKANNERRRFLMLFPKTKAYITFDAPNFKVRVGDFRSRLEAEQFLRGIQKNFEMSYVVPSKIKLPDLILE